MKYSTNIVKCFLISILFIIQIYNPILYAQNHNCTTGIIENIDETRFVKPNYKEIRESTYNIKVLSRNETITSKSKEMVQAANKQLYNTNAKIPFTFYPESSDLTKIIANKKIEDSISTTIAEHLLNEPGLFINETDKLQAIESLSQKIKECIFHSTFNGYSFAISVVTPNTRIKPRKRISMVNKSILLIPYTKDGVYYIRKFANKYLLDRALEYIKLKLYSYEITGYHNVLEEDKKIREEVLNMLKSLGDLIIDINLSNNAVSYPLKKTLVKDGIL